MDTPHTSGSAGQFRDLNNNGRRDPYEDPSVALDDRVSDLLSQMTLEEKAGQMFYPIAFIGFDPPGSPGAETLITDMRLSHITAFGDAEPRAIAEWTNQLQRWAASTRLGIPVTVATDPRHTVSTDPSDILATAAFSKWPGPLGFAAARDTAMMEEFAALARQDYLALGFRVSLNPMADLATEPRWGRISGTFGEDVETVSAMTAAYIRGFQGPVLGSDSVACMVKHFPGGGPQKDGEDPHFPHGREQIYPAGMFEHHLKPFEAAFAAGVAQVMPYYGMPVGTALEEVGFGFNRGVVTGLLRERFGFDGVVCADWGLLTDDEIFGKTLPARAWGVEHLSLPERAAKALEAGVDMFGGEQCPEVIVELVRSGAISEERIDISGRRLLRDKFRLGLFDQPFVDADRAPEIVRRNESWAAGERAQRRSIVLLKNGQESHLPVLPLRPGQRIWVQGIDPTVAATYAPFTQDIDDADVAIIRLATPYEVRDQYPLESFFHSGRLAFTDEELSPLLALLERKPAVIAIDLERPAVIPEIAAAAGALLATFGASDTALLDVIFGKFSPNGKLPFELPSSMEAVELQAPDAPHDSIDPLYPFGHGLDVQS